MPGKRLISISFEVMGKVQGTFFRKYAQERGKELELRGWCMNTVYGTVKGVMEGEYLKVQEMMCWLKHKGSPLSRIDKAEFKNEKPIRDFNYKTFSVIRTT